mmetsp:Transcript_49112/g.116936  ORF Transcript_49112/g.116936 Transcript_49112/m.116936 type:complete len:332 (-) Transcript_49112:79-1074(-)
MSDTRSAPAAPDQTRLVTLDVLLGSLVEATGLTSRPDLNGRCGVVTAKTETGRLSVQFRGEDGAKALRPEQLLLLRSGSDGAPMPQHFPSPDVRRQSMEVSDIKRILAFGDSLTAGFFDSGDQFCPYALSLARSLLPEVVADVWVNGLSGHEGKEMVEQVDTDHTTDAVGRAGVGLRWALQKTGPFDLVVIMAGTNDVGRWHEPADIARNVQQLHCICHEAGVSTVMLSVPQSGALFGEGRMHAEYRRNWEKLNELLSEWAAGAGVNKEGGPGVVSHVDTSKLVPYSDVSSDGAVPLFEDDTLHFTVAGSHRLGEGLAQTLRGLPQLLHNL